MSVWLLRDLLQRSCQRHNANCYDSFGEQRVVGEKYIAARGSCAHLGRGSPEWGAEGAEMPEYPSKMAKILNIV